MSSTCRVQDKVETAVFFEEIQVVQTGNKEDVPGSVTHQVLESLKARSVSVLDPKRIQLLFCHDGSPMISVLQPWQPLLLILDSWIIIKSRM
jgi:hypothetical protein